MKRYRRIYILLGVLAVACVATFGVMRFEEHKEQIKNSDEIILALSADSVQSLSWEYESEEGEEESLAFHRDETWLYDEDEAFPVDEEKIGALLEQFEAFGVSFIIEEVEDYGQYGLDDPVCTINLATEDASYEILLGDYSSMDSERYVSIGDGNVYLVSNDPLDSFAVTLSDMIDHDETPSFDSGATEITFAGTENYDIAYEENSTDSYCADDIYFTQQDGSNLPLDTSLVNSYLDNISNLNLTDYATYNATEEELKSYGLDEPELTVTVDYSLENEEGEETSETFVLNVSRDPEEKAASEEKEAERMESEADAEGAEEAAATEEAAGEAAVSGAAETAAEAEQSMEEEEITAYARVGESQIVYRISSEEYKNLMAASYDDLRHPEVLSADFADIYQIDISLEDNTYTLTSEETDDVRTWYYSEEELEISDLQNALKNLKANSFTEEQPTDKEEISLTVYLENENHPTVQIELYRCDGENCLAVVDGEPVSYISRAGVVDLIEAVHAIVLN